MSGNRGQSPNLIIVEEGDYVPRGIWFDVIAPLLGVYGTSIVAISTIKKNENGAISMYSYMMKLKDPIHPEDSLFKLIHIRGICDACLKAKKDKCPHMQIVPASWKDPESAARVRALMSSSREAMLAETAGVVLNSNTPLFNTLHIQRLQEARTFRSDQAQHDVVFISIDPSGGGRQSDYALMSFFFDGGHLSIVGLDAYTGNDLDAVNRMLFGHFKALRSQTRFSSSVVVLLVEGNGDWFKPNHLSDQFNSWDKCLRNAPRSNVVGFARGMHKTPAGQRIIEGTLTDHSMKQNSMIMVRTMLQMRLIHFDHHVVGENPSQSRGLLIQQLHNFHIELRTPKDQVTQRSKAYLTGKTSDGSSKDDLVLTLMMGVYWARQCHANEFVSRFVYSRGKNLPQTEP